MGGGVEVVVDRVIGAARSGRVLVSVDGVDASGKSTFAGVHAVAAILLFASLAMAVATHAWPGGFGGLGPGNPRYQTIFWLMVAGIPLAIVLELVIKSECTVIILEGWEIALFASFWIMEAERTWPAPGAAGQRGVLTP